MNNPDGSSNNWTVSRPLGIETFFTDLIADFDNDGDLDVFVGNNTDIQIILNDGNGNFVKRLKFWK